MNQNAILDQYENKYRAYRPWTRDEVPVGKELTNRYETKYKVLGVSDNGDVALMGLDAPFKDTFIFRNLIQLFNDWVYNGVCGTKITFRPWTRYEVPGGEMIRNKSTGKHYRIVSTWRKTVTLKNEDGTIHSCTQDLLDNWVRVDGGICGIEE